MGEISNFYNLSPRLLIFGTHISSVITTHSSKFHSCLSDTFLIIIFSFTGNRGLSSKSISLHKFKVRDLEIFLQYLIYTEKKSKYPYLRNVFLKERKKLIISVKTYFFYFYGVCSMEIIF